MANDQPILEVKNLTIALPAGGDRATAVRNVSFTVGRGEIVCLVGESGSGKSVIAQSVMGLLPKTLPVQAGQILLEGEDITHAPLSRLRELRATRMSMIFQEPMTALNPLFTVGQQLIQTIRTHLPLDERWRTVAAELMVAHLAAGGMIIGGSGVDTLKVAAGTTLDLVALTNNQTVKNIQEVEVFQMQGKSTLTMSANDVLSLGGANASTMSAYSFASTTQTATTNGVQPTGTTSSGMAISMGGPSRSPCLTLFPPRRHKRSGFRTR